MSDRAKLPVCSESANYWLIFIIENESDMDHPISANKLICQNVYFITNSSSLGFN